MQDNKTLNILLITANDFRRYGGLERVLLYFLEFINNKNIDLEIFAFKYVNKMDNYLLKDFEKYKSKIYRILKFNYYGLTGLFFFIKNFFNLELLYIYQELYNFLRYKKFDVILVTNAIYLNSVNEILNFLSYKAPVIYWDHGELVSFFSIKDKKNFLDIMQSFKKKEIIRGLSKTRYYLCISSGIERIIRSINSEARTYVVYNPVEIPKEKKLIPRGEKNVLLYVGRLEDRQKNISFMLKGLSELREYKWELRVIGTGPDEKKLRELARKLGIEGRIKWEGFKRNPYEDLEEVKVLLLTSRWEGLPLVLVEGNMRGIPFLSSDCNTGPEDIVIEGVNGYLYKEGDIKDFVNKLKKILINELKFEDPEEIFKTSLRFEKNAILDKIKTIILNI